MKTRKYLKLASLLLVAVLVLCQIPMTALAADVGLGIQEMIGAQIANPGTAVSHSVADYQFLHGDFDGKNLAPFTTNSGDCLTEGTEPNNGVWAWQWRCDTDKDTVLKITAKGNTFFKSEIQEDGQFHAGWAVGSSFRFVQENAAGERELVKEIVVKDTAQSVEDSTVITHLAAGESLYIVYSGTGLLTTDFCPWFTFNADTYDATLNPFYIAPPPSADVGLGIQEMIASEITNAGAVVSHSKVDYQFLHGDFDGKALAPFTTNSGDYLFEGSGDPTNAVWAWQWRCDTDKDTVLKITAKENLHVNSIIQGDGMFHAGWAVGSSFRFVQENAAGERKLVKEIVVKDAAQSVEDSTVNTHLAAGESLYIVYSGTGLLTTDFCPWFTFNAEKYDATQNPFYVEPGTEPNPQPAKTEDSNFSDLVTSTAANNGGKIEMTLADYQFLYGDFVNNGELKPFDKFATDLVWTGADDANSAHNALWRWQWRATENSQTVLKISAKESLALTFDQTAFAEKMWAFHSSFSIVHETASGKRTTVKTIAVKETFDVADAQFTVHLAKGDSLYIVYGLNEGGLGDVTSTFFPTMHLDTAAYEADKVPATGDDFAYVVPAFMLTAACCALAVLVLNKKRLTK